MGARPSSFPLTANPVAVSGYVSQLDKNLVFAFVQTQDGQVCMYVRQEMDTSLAPQAEVIAPPPPPPSISMIFVLQWTLSYPNTMGTRGSLDM